MEIVKPIRRRVIPLSTLGLLLITLEKARRHDYTSPNNSWKLLEMERPLSGLERPFTDGNTKPHFSYRCAGEDIEYG
jgi:hypothetical protein